MSSEAIILADGGVSVEVRCDFPNCAEVKQYAFGEESDDVLLSANLAAGQAGWRYDGRGRRLCPVHWAMSKDDQPGRGGFTLVELVVVLAIVSIAAAVALPLALPDGRRAATNAAALVQGERTAAVARAQRDGVSGLRLVPDPTFTPPRLEGGEIDPAAPLAFDRILPLRLPAAIQSGKVAVHDAYPAGFTAPYGVLVLEQEVRRVEPTGLLVGGEPVSLRVLNEPTSWAWRVRLGDRVELGTRAFTVCGPMAVANPEGYVNYPPAGTGYDLDRGDGPAEWLALVNGVDDDGDGWIDNGFDGRDNDANGQVDEPAEWIETEKWGPIGVVSDSAYAIRPRPTPAEGVGCVLLAGAVVDATGWDAASPTRSRLPVDRFGGFVDLLVYPDGRIEPANRYAPGVPPAGPLAKPYYHFWICPRESVGAAKPEDVGVLLTVNGRTGLATSGDADPADPARSRRKMEGGGL